MIDAWQFSHSKQYKLFLDKQTKGFTCCECDKTFSAASHRKRHFIDIHFEHKSEFFECKQLFGRLDNLNLHKRNKHEVSDGSVEDLQKLRTSSCKVDKLSGSAIKEHSESTSVKEQFICESCKKIFSTKFNLSFHKRQIKHSCNECNKMFCTKGALILHRKRFVCDGWKKEFKLKGNWKRHIDNKLILSCE